MVPAVEVSYDLRDLGGSRPEGNENQPLWGNRSVGRREPKTCRLGL